MSSWVLLLLLLLLLGFAQDIPFLVHEVTAASSPTTTFSSVESSPAITNDIDTSSGTTTNATSSDAPINETTSAASSVSPSPIGSTLIASIQTSSIITTESATITPITSSKEPHTSQETAPSTAAAQASETKEPSLSQNPGLVAVICIFVSVLFIAGVVILVKFCHRREPAFKKLDEVPMGKVAEDSPFARYPPK